MTSTTGLQNVKRKFASGDTYDGQWKNNRPEGEGKYVWVDGSDYVGQWKGGTKHGYGTYRWPSGAVYKGEWFEGYMHGTGRFDAPDGTYYSGGWSYDRKHGLGQKRYANGDNYEGLWKHGRSHGPGRYRWADGSEYDGDWVNGKMHGQGTFVWKSKERYDGQWREGKEEGMGVFTWSNGSRYDGFWHNGKKHGLGVYRPPPDIEKIHARFNSIGSHEEIDDSTSVDSFQSSVTSMASHSYTKSLTSDTSRSYSRSEGPVSVPSWSTQSQNNSGASSNQKTQDQIFLREYDRGKMVREEKLNEEDVGVLKYVLDQALELSEGRRKRLFGKSSIKQLNKVPGELIYKGHRSYDLMLSLQLGIRWSVGRVEQQPDPKHITNEHFNQKAKQLFPRNGSQNTPPHRATDFKWKEYCPMVFRKLRQCFGVSPAEYMLSLCGDMALRELVSPGKSGAMFYISNDGRFFIKTMRKNEMKLLLECLPGYYRHIDKYPHTLVTKFYGLHRITPGNGRTVRFVVMGNIFQTNLKLHRRYDLKGSTFGRTVGQWPPPGKDAKEAGDPPVFKDLDLDVCFKLEKSWHNRLIKQLEADSQLLNELKVMDYSLLLGVHYKTGHPDSLYNDEHTDEHETDHEGVEGSEEHPILAKARQKLTDGKIEGKRAEDLLAIVENAVNSLKSRKELKGGIDSKMKLNLTETMRPNADAGDLGSTEELAYISGQTRVELGAGMVATALPMQQEDQGQGQGQGEDKFQQGGGEAVILFFGVIDFLQEYSLSKKLEHNLKAITQDGKGVSVVNPTAYSQRFLNFMKKVFV
eukprot:TRINITY_DN3312_c1_g1_i2.p2 TRINITY_DN3312_c1_g1~~TRINITY_DN3312_c1_g1_i2.p2  ORF type:complete len:868 (-),score=148.82 TRINITY_DN3312_c1_g1_i2:719-3133(-)